MNKLLLSFFLAITFSAFGQKQQAKPGKKFTLPVGITSKDYIPGIVIVKFKADAVKSKSAAKTQAFVLPQVSVKNITTVSVARKFADTEVPSSTDGVSFGLDRIFDIKFPANTNLEQVINELLQDTRIEYAEPSYIYHTYYSPNDTQFLSGGQSYLSQVKAPAAWDIIRNSSGVIIAIVDSGSELTHPDLAANIFLNAADPENGIDDDNDGYIDNYKGWDFVGASVNQILEDNDPGIKNDSSYHGVHVSGIASAVSDNATGVASIAFNAKLMIVKAGADDNGSAIYRGYDGIKYAADHGANIINCSWGGTGGGAFGADIINYAISKGCLITAAAGNNNTSAPDYPAAYPGVLSVANVNDVDVKGSSSNYGAYVTLAAPGVNILSTSPNGSYGTLSGTSMAAPVVASAAALVKSYFPTLTMQQVGERLRATADDINANNPGFSGQLGKGRLNVFRALTESPSSVRNQKITIAGNGNTSVPAGDTATIYFDLKNFLSPISNLQISLSSSNTNVTITSANQLVQTINTLETKTLVGPFKVYIKPGTPDNSNILFRISYAANNGSYQDSEAFVLTVSLDFINIEVNQVSTTLTSNGRVGYSSPNLTNGLGFVYRNQQLLYESALMIGVSSTQVSNNAQNGIDYDNHFVKKVRATKVNSTGPAFDGRSEFNDSNNPDKLNLYIKHRQIAFNQSPDDKYTIAEYDVYNNSTVDLKGVYIGLLTDWDIDLGSNNVTTYDNINRIGYVSAKTPGALYGAIKLLSTIANPLYYPLSYAVSGILSDGLFSIGEKFQTLSSGIQSLSLGNNSANGYDVMFVSGYGPYTIPAKSSVKVAFAFIAGDDLADIQKSAAAADLKYPTIPSVAPPANASLELRQNYPNPFPVSGSSTTTIEYTIPESGDVSIALYDLLGRKVKTYLNEFTGMGNHKLLIDSYDLENGIYFCRVRYKNETKALKVVVVK